MSGQEKVKLRTVKERERKKKLRDEKKETPVPGNCVERKVRQVCGME